VAPAAGPHAADRLEQGRIIEDEEIKASLANAEPYEEWLESAQYNIKDLDVVEPELAQLPVETTTLLDRQQAFGYTQEDISKFLEPMGAMAMTRSDRWAPIRRLPCSRASRVCSTITSSRTSRR
jgi:hypothetical protein